MVIHEGQITYQEQGYHKILEFGELWRDETKGLPLPLGLDVVRRALGETLAGELSVGLRDSIDYGYKHQDESIPYALEWGRGIDAAKGSTFVKMYVLRLGVLDGVPGLILCVLSSAYVFTKYAKLWELQRSSAVRKG